MAIISSAIIQLSNNLSVQTSFHGKTFAQMVFCLLMVAFDVKPQWTLLQEGRNCRRLKCRHSKLAGIIHAVLSFPVRSKQVSGFLNVRIKTLSSETDVTPSPYVFGLDFVLSGFSTLTSSSTIQPSLHHRTIDQRKR